MRFVLFLFFASLLSGCAHYKAKPISPSENADRLEQRSLEDPGLKTFVETNLHREFVNWPVASWDMEMLTLAAYYYHPDLEIARAQWHVAQASIKTAGGRPNPTLSITPEYNTTKSIPTPWAPAINLDIPLETAGKRGDRIAQAERLSESARLNVVTAAWQIRSDVRTSLVDFVVVQQREALLQKQVSRQEEIIRLLEQQLHAGAISGSELTLIRIALQTARLDLADAQRQKAESRAHLAKAIGVAPHALDGFEFSFDLQNAIPSTTDLTSAEIRREAMLGRSDILGALADYAAAEAGLRLEIAKQYPDIHLNPGYQYDQGENKWSIGVSFELPILNQNQGPIGEAKAQREKAAATFNALQEKVLAEIESAIETFRVTDKTSTLLSSLADEQESRRGSVEAQYRAGAVDRLELMNSQLDFIASQVARLDGQLKVQQAIGALEDAVQHPLNPATAPPVAVLNPNPPSAEAKKESNP
jgi:outer membrane protein TolC